MSTRVSLEGDEYIEIFNGEDYKSCGSDTYGIRIGELSIADIKLEQMVRLAQAVVNHLIVCGHRFELRQLQGEYHDSLEVWKPSVPDMPNIPPPPPKKGNNDGGHMCLGEGEGMTMNNVVWRDKYPRIDITVKDFRNLPATDIFSWLHDHRYVVINDELSFVIHIGLAGLIQCGRTLTLWYQRSDPHDRFLEVLCVEEKRPVQEE